MNLFDASALLAFVNAGPGTDVVERELLVGGVVSAANWSEVAQKIRGAGADWSLARAVLLSFDLAVEPVVGADAERAAELWRRDSGLSLADR
ncbi:MAG: PIN domain-containing protein, partial [Frankiales bacterium]|nr:PIN domain-containing protein [Frankiales bacterium]